MSNFHYECKSSSGTAIKDTVIEVTTESETTFIDKKPENESTTIHSYGGSEFCFIHQKPWPCDVNNILTDNKRPIESTSSGGITGVVVAVSSHSETNFVDYNALESVASSGSSGDNNCVLPFDCFGPYSRLICAVLSLQVLTVISFGFYNIPMLLINGQCLSCSPKFEIFDQQYYRMFGRYYYASDVMNLYLSMTVCVDSMIGIWYYVWKDYCVHLYFGPLMFMVSIFAMVMRFYVFGAFILLSSVLKFCTSYLKERSMSVM